MQNSHYQLITIIFILAQLLILVFFGYTPYPDSNGYQLLGQECVDYGEPYPITSKINDYPFLWNIGAINAAASSLYLFNSIKPLLVVYSLMKGVTAFFLYAVTNKVYGQKTALIALVLYVIYPANYGEGTSLNSETPFIFFIFLSIYLAIAKNWIFVAGIMLAVANYFRPMSIVFLLAIIIYFMFKWKKSIKLILGYVTMIFIIGTATMSRTGLFLYQAKTGWMALMDYSTGESQASQEVRDHYEWNVAQKDSVWQALFIDWVKDHPIEYISQMPKKLINTYVSDNVNMCTFLPNKTEREYMYEEISMSTLVKDFPKYSAIQLLTLFNYVIYLMLLISSIISLSHFEKETYLLPLSVILLGTLLLLFVGHGEARFHIPFMPFIIMLSANFINKKYGKNLVY